MAEALPIIFRDEWLIAVHKPSGLLVHRTDIDRHETRFAVQILRDQIGCRVYPVHRLDKGTSGVLLFAFQPEVAQQVSSQFERQEVDKTYLAVVRGWPEESGTVDHALSRIVDAYAGNSHDSDALQNAITHFRRLATCEIAFAVDRYPTSRYALLELHPVTGRRHQLRRHLKHLSHPIIGDATYGKGRHNRFFQEHFGSHRLLLASVHMRLKHVVTGEDVVLDAGLSEDFLRLLAELGWTAPETACAP